MTVTGADDVEVTVTDASRIIPANGDIAEVVFALGLGDSVVATDISATYPPEADALPEVGYQRTLLAETMLGLDPTVVVANTDAGPPEVLDQLRRAGVPVVVVDYPHDLTGPAAKIRLVASALGVPARDDAAAGEVVATVFDSSVPFEDKVALIEDGESHRADHEGYVAAADAVGGITVEPTDVAPDGDTATVTYRVLFGGNEAYSDLEMDVTRVDGEWIVPTDAFCGFLASARTPCATASG